ncbi:MAG: rhomboid family intramembrane serine protease [Dehalococcoidia bacterium]
MIPIGDSVRARTFPYVNIAIIIANFLVFFYEVGFVSNINKLFFDWAVVPAELTDYLGNPGDHPLRILFTPITAMFLHGGWFHIAGNMIFLWVFGDNVEDAVGHLRYLAFYLLCGIAATAAQVWIDPNSQVPTLGASGAIAGVLGAYLVLYPRATIAAVIMPFFFWTAYVPAFLLIGFWFFLQLFNGVASIGYAVGASEGVAWWAHVGGFSAGFLLLWFFRPRRRSAGIGR